MAGQVLGALVTELRFADAERLRSDGVELIRSYQSCLAEGLIPAGTTFTEFAADKPVFRAYNKVHIERFGAPIA